MPVLRTMRVYNKPDDGDGMRVLVDRLWPRGLSKQVAAADLWLKAVAPSASLRRRFHASPEYWDDLRKDYLAEVRDKPALAEVRDKPALAEVRDKPALAELRRLAKRECVTLLYGWHDTEHNHAMLLADLLRKR